MSSWQQSKTIGRWGGKERHGLTQNSLQSVIGGDRSSGSAIQATWRLSEFGSVKPLHIGIASSNGTTETNVGGVDTQSKASSQSEQERRQGKSRKAGDRASQTGEEMSAQTVAEEVNSEKIAQQKLEAVLFISREPLSFRKLAQLADLADATQARTLTRQLNESYDRFGYPFRVEEVAGGYMVLTRSAFAPWLRKVDGIPGGEYLPQGLLETLSVVAYRQPVMRADIEAIRGVGCDEVLKQLMQRDLIKICGRSEELGRPYLYGTTRRFLQLFGLRSLERLPRREWVNPSPNEVQFPDDTSDNTKPN